ncbi:unnamed protein product [marine sediment metagenome]|uniref:Uncharacterized protein n=1 Tax=marine sediment metagenome TaxID=412755 RepID=X0U828_9ZZZZ
MKRILLMILIMLMPIICYSTTMNFDTDTSFTTLTISTISASTRLDCTDVISITSDLIPEDLTVYGEYTFDDTIELPAYKNNPYFLLDASAIGTGVYLIVKWIEYLL